MVQLSAAASFFAQSLSGFATIQNSASNSLTMNGVDATSSALKCSAAVSAGVRRRDAKFLRAIFDRHKDSANSLSASKLTAALTEADAPIIPDSDAAALAIVAQFDSNSNGTMEFGEFVSAVNAPDELALYFEEKQHPALADALRALVGRGSDQLLRVSQMSRDNVLAASAAVQASLEEQATSLHKELQCSFAEQFEICAQMEIDAGKFNVVKMACGGIADFHQGLAGRVGMPHLGFKDAMKQEHCKRAGCDTLFTTSNYKIATTPRQEWLYIAGNDEGQRVLCPDMGHGRRIPSISELMKLKLSVDAKLTEVEMLAIILYTGPMFQVSKLGVVACSSCKVDALFRSTTAFCANIQKKCSRCLTREVTVMRPPFSCLFLPFKRFHDVHASPKALCCTVGWVVLLISPMHIMMRTSLDAAASWNGA
jgi:hypothetical protein